MSLVTAISEKIEQLTEKIARWNANGQTARLYVNNHVPTPYDTLADYTPCTVPGVNPLPTTWPFVPADDGDGTASVRGAVVQWTPSMIASGQDVYGVVFVDDVSGQFQYAQKFATPFLGFGATLDPITVLPVYQDDDIP